jgi:hypothetical protein
MKLSITQMVLGALAVISSCFIVVSWLAPKANLSLYEINGATVQILTQAESVQVIATISTFLIFILGWGVLSVGIAQFIRAKR